MATVNDTYMGLVDRANLLDPDGSVAMVANELEKESPFIQDMVFREGNLDTGFKHSALVSLPSVTWTQLYQGVAPTKAARKQVTDTCGLVEALADIDERLLELGGIEAALRHEETQAHLQAMSEEVETGMFYHNEKTDPEKITGLGPRYNTLPSSWAQFYHSDYRDHVKDGAGTGSDNTSIWLVHHGPEGVFGIYPKGTQLGIQTIDRGSQRVLDDSSNPYYVKEMHLKWQTGLAIKNYRSVVRICNIDYSNLSTTGDTLVPLMIDAYHRMPAKFRRNAKWYVNPDIAAFLHHQARNKTNISLMLGEFDGMEIVKCCGAPIRESNALLLTESAITT